MKTLLVLALLLTASPAWAAAPVILFSDMTDAPITGWESSAAKGAAVSIWGRNFGTSRGSSTLTVGGVTLSDAADFAEWGATTYPTVPLGMQRITFFLNSSMSTSGTYPNTTITVTVGGVASNSLAFHTRTLGSAHIYFFDAASGSDSNSGLTVALAKQKTSWARRYLVAGDVAYLKAGTYNEHDAQIYCNGTCGGYHYGGLMSFGSSGSGYNHANGTEGNSITVTAYPAENVVMDGSTGTDGDGGTLMSVLTSYYSAGDAINYWTFSKFTMKGLQYAVDLASSESTYSTQNIRIIGNDMTTVASCTSQWGNILLHYGGGGADGFFMYGNSLHDACSDYHGDISYLCGHDGEAGYERRVYNVYIGGYGDLTNVDIGWNEFGYNINGRGFQIYGHLSTDTLDNFTLHDNWFHDHIRQNAVIGGGDGASDYTFVTEAIVFNNIFSHPADGDPAVIAGGVGNGDGGVYYLYNNVFEKATTSASMPLMNITLGTFTVKNNIFLIPANDYDYYSYYPYGSCGGTGGSCTGTNNLYYGAGANATPVWDTSTLVNNDPVFIDSTPDDYTDYALQATSPAIGAGADLSGTFTRDFVATPRGSTFDIGAFEYLAPATQHAAPWLIRVLK
jgi:hypothetical protein